MMAAQQLALPLVTPEDLTPLQKAILRAMPHIGATHVACTQHAAGCRQLEALELVTVVSPGTSSTVAALTDLGRKIKRYL